MAPKRLTLVLLEKGSEILLGLKKRGFGKGLWNGFGGKVEPGEEIVDAATRYVFSKLILLNLGWGFKCKLLHSTTKLSTRLNTAKCISYLRENRIEP